MYIEWQKKKSKSEKQYALKFNQTAPTLLGCSHGSGYITFDFYSFLGILRITMKPEISTSQHSIQLLHYFR